MSLIAMSECDGSPPELPPPAAPPSLAAPDDDAGHKLRVAVAHPLTLDDVRRWDDLLRPFLEQFPHVYPSAPSTGGTNESSSLGTDLPPLPLTPALATALLSRSPIPPYDPSESPMGLPKQSAVAQLSHKSKFNAFWQRLPIHHHKNAIIAAFRAHRTLIIAGDVGVGKSTLLPQLIAETDVMTKPTKKRLIVVQPSVALAHAVAARLQETFGDVCFVAVVTGVGDVAPADRANLYATAPVVVTTPSVLLRALLVDNELHHQVGAIIVDECQSMSLVAELLLETIRHLMAHGTLRSRLVVNVTAPYPALHALMLEAKATAGTPIVLHSAIAQAESAIEAQNRSGVAKCLIALSDYFSAVVLPPSLAAATGARTASATLRDVGVVFVDQSGATGVTALVGTAAKGPDGSMVTVAHAFVPQSAPTVYHLDESLSWLSRAQTVVDQAAAQQLLPTESNVHHAGGGTTSGGASSAADIATLPLLQRLESVPFTFSPAWTATWGKTIADFIAAYHRAASALPSKPGDVHAAIVVFLPTVQHGASVKTILQLNSASLCATFAVFVVDAYSGMGDGMPLAEVHACARRAQHSMSAPLRPVLLLCGDSSIDAQVSFSFPVGCVIDSSRELAECIDATVTAASTIEATSKLSVEWTSRESLALRRRWITVPKHGMVVRLVQHESVVQSFRPHRPMASFTHRTSLQHACEAGLLFLTAQLLLPGYTNTTVTTTGVSAAAAAANNRTEFQRFVSTRLPMSADLATTVAAAAAMPLTALGMRQEAVGRAFLAIDDRLKVSGFVASATSGRFSDDATATKQPTAFGWLALTLALPLPIVKLLSTAAMLGRLPAACTVAASWLIGDPFRLADDQLHADNESITVANATTSAIVSAAKKFFSQDSASDAVAALHLVRTWAIAHCGDDEAAKAELDQELFGSESGISKSHVEKIWKVRQRLLDTVKQKLDFTGVSASVSVGNGVEHGLVDDDTEGAPSEDDGGSVRLDPLLAVALAHALYPAIAVPPQKSRGRWCGPAIPSVPLDVAAVEAGSGVQRVSASVHEPRSAPITISCLCTSAAFHAVTSANDSAVATGKVKLFGYANAKRVSHDGVVTLHDVSSISAVAAIGASSHISTAALTSKSGADARKRARCRGWYAPLATVWRDSALASRHLPPPVTGKSKPVALQLFDVVQSTPMRATADRVLSADVNDRTCRVLRHTRAAFWTALAEVTMQPQIARVLTKPQQMHNAGLLSKPNMPHAPGAPIEGLCDVLRWSTDREFKSSQWLRERRRISTGKASSGAAAVAAAHHHAPPRVKLFPFYEYTDAIGQKPVAVDERALRHSADDDAEPGSPQKGASGASVGPAEYDGPKPTDAETIGWITQAAQSIAAIGSRNQERILLERQPDKFGFLNPTHAFYGYYNHLLRRLAPNMSWLGDDLSELEAYLAKLEVELAAEHRPNGAANPSAPESAAPFGATARSAGAGGRAGMGRLDYSGAFAGQSGGYYGYEGGGGSGGATLVNRADLAAARAFGDDADAFGAGQGDGGAGPDDAGGGNTDGDGGKRPRTDEDEEVDMLAAVLGDDDGEKGIGSHDGAGPAAGQGGGILGGVPTGAPVAGGSHTAAGVLPPPPATQQPTVSGDTAANANSSSNAKVNYLELHDPADSTKIIHPLSRKPPALPVDLTAPRPPSVLVGPVPRKEVPNLPLILAKALGENLSVKVGPTLIIGDCARIDVPNSKVEQRAIDMGVFKCIGVDVKIMKNDRILDNPKLAGRGAFNKKIDHIKSKLRSEHPRHLQRVEYSPEREAEKPAQEGQRHGTADDASRSGANPAGVGTGAQPGTSFDGPDSAPMGMFAHPAGMFPHHHHHHHHPFGPHHQGGAGGMVPPQFRPGGGYMGGPPPMAMMGGPPQFGGGMMGMGPWPPQGHHHHHHHNGGVSFGNQFAPPQQQQQQPGAGGYSSHPTSVVGAQPHHPHGAVDGPTQNTNTAAAAAAGTTAAAMAWNAASSESSSSDSD